MKKFTTLSDFPLLSLHSIRVRCKRQTCAGQRWYLLSNSKWTHRLTLCKHPTVRIGRSLLKWPACNPRTFPRGLSETRTVYIGAVRILFSCSEKKEMTTTTVKKKKIWKSIKRRARWRPSVAANQMERHFRLGSALQGTEMRRRCLIHYGSEKNSQYRENRPRWRYRLIDPGNVMKKREQNRWEENDAKTTSLTLFE